MAIDTAWEDELLRSLERVNQTRRRKRLPFYGRIYWYHVGRAHGMITCLEAQGVPWKRKLRERVREETLQRFLTFVSR